MLVYSGLHWFLLWICCWFCFCLWFDMLAVYYSMTSPSCCISDSLSSHNGVKHGQFQEMIWCEMWYLHHVSVIRCHCMCFTSFPQGSFSCWILFLNKFGHPWSNSILLHYESYKNRTFFSGFNMQIYTNVYNIIYPSPIHSKHLSKHSCTFI